MTWKIGGHNNAFRAYEVSISNIEDRVSAEQEIESLIELVNRTWVLRNETMPDYSTRPRPTPMMIYKLLPHTDCKQCGEPTCYSFALKLAASQWELGDYPPLHESQYADKRVGFEETIVKAPSAK